MNKFEETLQKYYTLLEFGKSASTAYAAQGGTGLNLGGSPIRPLPGMVDTGDMEQNIDKNPVKPQTPEELEKLQRQDNEGQIRQVMNKLANNIPLTQADQEIVGAIKSVAGQAKKSSLNPNIDKQPVSSIKPTNTSKPSSLNTAVVSDDVETLNNPNRPKISYAQS